MSRLKLFPGDINPYPANLENMVSFYNASKWQMGFNLAFKWLTIWPVTLSLCIPCTLIKIILFIQDSKKCTLDIYNTILSLQL